MKERSLCPHCWHPLDLMTAVDRGDFWEVECDHCHRKVMKAKPTRVRVLRDEPQD